MTAQTSASRPPTTQPKASTTTTRRAVADISALSKTQLLDKCKTKVKDANTAAKWLVEKNLVEASTPSLEALVMGMLRAATGTQAQTKESLLQAMVSLAYYADTIAKGPERGLAEQVADVVSARMDNALKAVTSKMSDACEALYAATTTSSARTDELKQACVTLEERALDLNVAAASAAAGGECVGTGVPATYAGALGPHAPRAFLSPEQERARSKAALQARQTLLDGVSLLDGQGNRIETRVLKAKFEEAVEIMKRGGQTEVPEDLKVSAVNVLRNGGVVVEWRTKQGAEWVRREPNARLLQAAVGPDVQLKERLFKVVAKFVPVECDPAKETEDIEATNRLPGGCISTARWIRPVEKRRPGQQCAHVQVCFKTPQDANEAIRNRLSIGGKRVFVHRDLPEPFRCAKCLKFKPYHQAKDCPAAKQTCGTCCSTAHKTQDCTVTARSKFKCAVCQEVGHATWDRNCPAYCEEVARLVDRNPDLRNPFFPTDEDRSSYPPLPSTRLPTPPSGHFTSGANTEPLGRGRSPMATQWSLYDAVGDEQSWTGLRGTGARPSQKQRKLAFRQQEEEQSADEYPPTHPLTNA